MRGWALKGCVLVEYDACFNSEGLMFCTSCFLVETRGRAISPYQK